MTGTEEKDRRDLFAEMLRIRRFEERCVELYSAGSIRGFMHLCIGEEAVAVGVLQALDPDAFTTVRDLIGRLAALATGRLAIFREMRELDDRLGLTPKGMAALRWTIVDDPASLDDGPLPDGVSDMTSRRRTISDAS